VKKSTEVGCLQVGANPCTCFFATTFTYKFWSAGLAIYYSLALAAKLSTTEMFSSKSRGKPCRSCKYVELL